MKFIETLHRLLDSVHHCSVLVFPLPKLLCWEFRCFVLRNKALVYFTYLVSWPPILLVGTFEKLKLTLLNVTICYQSAAETYPSTWLQVLFWRGIAFSRITVVGSSKESYPIMLSVSGVATWAWVLGDSLSITKSNRSHAYFFPIVGFCNLQSVIRSQIYAEKAYSFL